VPEAGVEDDVGQPELPVAVHVVVDVERELHGRVTPLGHDGRQLAQRLECRLAVAPLEPVRHLCPQFVDAGLTRFGCRGSGFVAGGGVRCCRRVVGGGVRCRMRGGAERLRRVR